MCGIFGWSLKQNSGLSNTKRKKVFDVLATANDTRGGQSYGVYVADSQTIYKGLDNMNGARYFPLAGDVLPFKADTFFAHTRFATQGNITLDNAHPFEIGNIIGAHNGIVYNHSDLNAIYGRKCAVDSMHLFEHINECLGMGDIEAYGTIEYSDKRAPKAVLLCTFDGELAVAMTPYGIFWSSKLEHLELALDYARIRHAECTINDRKLYRIFEGTIQELPIVLHVAKRSGQFKPRSWRDGYLGDATYDDPGLTDIEADRRALARWSNDDMPESEETFEQYGEDGSLTIWDRDGNILEAYDRDGNDLDVDEIEIDSFGNIKGNYEFPEPWDETDYARAFMRESAYMRVG